MVRVGDTVRRTASPWTPAAHALLIHLETVGFEYSPRALGIDDSGREVLTFLEGESGADSWPKVVDAAGFERFARLLRRYHDAVIDFRPDPGSDWAFGPGALAPGEIVCHGDFGPFNVVWRGLRPVGIIDWEFAGPGPPIDDVAYALEYSVPFRDDQTCLRWLAWDEPPDRRRRLAAFAEAYGLASPEGLVDRVIARQRLDAERVRSLAARGFERQSTWGRRRVHRRA